jgi:hypothetical protein
VLQGLYFTVPRTERGWPGSCDGDGKRKSERGGCCQSDSSSNGNDSLTEQYCEHFSTTIAESEIDIQSQVKQMMRTLSEELTV